LPRPESTPTIDPRIRQRRLEVERQAGRHRLRVAVAVAAVATVVAGGVAALHSPLLGVRHVEVVGIGGRRAAAVAVRSGVRHGQPLVDVDLGAVRARVDRLAWVASASAERAWPDAVRIVVRSRVAVAEMALTPPPASGAPGVARSARLATGGAVAVLDVTGRVIAVDPSPVAGLPLLVGFGRPAPLGAWLAGSPGAGGTPGSARTEPADVSLSDPDPPTSIAAALAVCASLVADRLAVGEVAQSEASGLVVEIGRSVVDFDGISQLVAKVDDLRALVAAGALAAPVTVDLQAPSRPALSVGVAAGS